MYMVPTGRSNHCNRFTKSHHYVKNAYVYIFEANHIYKLVSCRLNEVLNNLLVDKSQL